MKGLLLASAVLGLAGTIGTANAVPISSSNITIWTGDTPGDVSTSVRQQGLPTATTFAQALNPAGLPLIADGSDFANPINYNDTTNDTIGGFFTTAGLATPSTCNAACQATTLSTGGFAHATMFVFVFTAPSTGTLTITHDDGISLFPFLTEDGTNSTDLLPIADAAPTPATTSIGVTGGVTYDLWNSAANGLPEVLQTDLAISTPEPASMTLLGSALIGLGWLCRRRRKSA